MLKNYILFCICISWSFTAFNQNGLPSTLGARSVAMGGTGLTFIDIQALLNNPAGLAQLNSFSGIIAAEQRFASEELQSLAAGIALPTSSGSWGLGLQYFGFDLYNEKRINLAYARQLLDNFSMGIQFVFHNTQIQEYGNKWSIAAELGLLYEVNDNISIGAQIFNPIRTEIVEGEFLPTVFRVGFGYKSSEKVLFLAEISKDIEYPVQVRFGIEYRIITQLFLRSGIQTAPEKWSFGIGYLLNQENLSIDVSASHHPFLGFSPAITMTYQSK